MRPWLLVAGDFVPSGGMDAANLALASWLARSGRPTHLVAHRVDPALAALPGVQLHPVTRPLGSHLLGFPLLRRAAARQAARLRQGGASPLVLANGGNAAGDATWLHYVHAAHTPASAAGAARRLRERWATQAARHDERRVAAAARVVLANSQRTAADARALLGVPAQRVQVVYYGADPQLVPPTPAERAAARRSLGVGEETPLLLFVGALGDRRKGFDLLFGAFAALCREPGWDAVLLAAGAGAELPAWRQRAEAQGLAERIRLLGFVPRVRPLLAAADALVAPSRYEAYGLAVQEGLCCGLPALVSREAGVAERIPAELAPLLLDPAAGAGALAERLRAWRAELPRWAAAAGALAPRLRGWSWDQMAARIVDIVEGAA